MLYGVVRRDSRKPRKEHPGNHGFNGLAANILQDPTTPIITTIR